MKIIYSKDNKEFKKYKSLLVKKHRDKAGEYLVEGQRFVDQAISQHQEITAVIIEQSHEELIEYYSNMPIVILDDSCFKELSDTVHSQGVIAIVKKKKSHEIDYESPILVMDRIQDPGNLGTMIRTAVAAGLTQVALSKATVDPFNPKVVRSTAGALNSINLIESQDLSEMINILRQKNYQIIGTTMGAKRSFDAVEYGSKTAIIIGNEGNGISEEILEQTDFNISIPLFGEVESLNASIAAAIVLYEIGKQLNK